MKKLVSIAVTAALLTSVSFSANAQDSTFSTRVKSAADTDFSYTYVGLNYVKGSDTSGLSLKGSLQLLQDKPWGGFSLIGNYRNLKGKNGGDDYRTISAGALYHLNAGNLFKVPELNPMDLYVSTEIINNNIPGLTDDMGLLIKNGVRYHVTKEFEVNAGWNYDTTWDADLYLNTGVAYSVNEMFHLNADVVFGNDSLDSTLFQLGASVNF